MCYLVTRLASAKCQPHLLLTREFGEANEKRAVTKLRPLVCGYLGGAEERWKLSGKTSVCLGISPSSDRPFSRLLRPALFTEFRNVNSLATCALTHPIRNF